MGATRKAILIDGDMLAMRALTSCEVEIEFEPLLWTRYAEVDKALEQYQRLHRSADRAMAWV
jgi:hypothetical protein